MQVTAIIFTLSNREISKSLKPLLQIFACDCMAIVIKAEFRSFPLSYHQIKISAYYRNTPKKLSFQVILKGY